MIPARAWVRFFSPPNAENSDRTDVFEPVTGPTVVVCELLCFLPCECTIEPIERSSMNSIEEGRGAILDHRPRTLLVVEDERLLRWSIKEALKAEYRIFQAGSSEEALDLIPHLEQLDGILIDVRLPGMDGLQFARQARDERPNLKVFVMTAYDLANAPKQAFQLNADGYLPKPFEMETLRCLLTSHL